MDYEFENSIFPEFPVTPHLPSFGTYIPNTGRLDKIAPDSVLDDILGNECYVEEKIDGANAGIMYCPSLVKEIGQEFILRNRNHILRKGFSAKTKGKKQFVPFWNWYYSNTDKFEKLNKIVGFAAGVYGEWLWPENPSTIIYDFDVVPDKFIAYEIWDYHTESFYPSARIVLQHAGFTVPPLLLPRVEKLSDLLPLLEQKSEWSAPAAKQKEPCQTKREGLVIKMPLLENQMRYKMVRADYKPGMWFDDNKDG